MKRKIALMVVAGAWIGLLAGARAQDEAVPELGVLGKYAGEWEASFTVKGGADSAEEPKPMTAEVKAKWALGGRFVRQVGKVEFEEGGETFILETLMTYDPVEKVYRGWTFTSGGSASEATGNWDAASNTMTWKSEDPRTGQTTTTSATFKGEDEEHWSIATGDRSGKMVSLIAGVNRRK